VTIDQLWFGWVARGAEGVNKEQIIAASGVLDDRSQGTTRAVLAACYRPRRETFGWIDAPGVRIVFRRNLTGVDDWGRPGRFFVHALAGTPSILTPETLARLWDAEIWERSALDAPDDKLRALSSNADLRLGPTPAAIDRQALTAMLAGHLRHVAWGRRSAIALGDHDAVIAAAEIARVLPARFSPHGFSTDEPGERAEAYDLVAGAPPNGRFGAVGPDIESDDGWRAAARLVLAAADRHEHAVATVEALAGRVGSAQEFAAATYYWAELDREADPDRELDEQALRRPLGWAAEDSRLALVLVNGPGVDTVARAFVEEMPEALRIIASTNDRSRGNGLVAALALAIERLSPQRGTALLERLGRSAPALAEEIAGLVLTAWSHARALETVSPGQALTLLRFVAARGAAPEQAAQELLSRQPMTAPIARSRDLPVAWRACAVAANPTEVPPADLARLLIEEPGFAATVLERAAPRVLDALGAAVDAVSPQVADAVIDAASPFLKGFELEACRWSVAERVDDPVERYHRMGSLIVDGSRRSSATDRALDAYARAVLACRASGRLALPDDRVLASGTSRCARAWRTLRQALRLRPPNTRAAVEATKALGDLHADAALELCAEEVLASCRHARDFRELRVLAEHSGERDEDHAVRVARTAMRRRGCARPWEQVVAVMWIAYLVAVGSLDASVLDLPELQRLAPIPDSSARAWVSWRGDEFRRPRALRHWHRALTAEATAPRPPLRLRRWRAGAE
jgi:hypothetical protein